MKKTVGGALSFLHALKMWSGIFLVAFGLFTAAELRSTTTHKLCDATSPYARKVRISLKAALGDNAYPWDDSEEFYFQATVAYGMRKFTNRSFSVDDVHICEETVRISFYFMVTGPENVSNPVPRIQVDEAIKMVRGRFNDAFSLDDSTLEFVGIKPTLPTVSEPPVTVWLIVFGIVIGLVLVAFIALMVTGHREKMKKGKVQEEDENEEIEDKTLKGTENGVYCTVLDSNDGLKNEAFCLDDDKLTQL
ncbi:collectrin isoform X2 [Callorhinchus milii]|uniref:collectrin isoform X2 n=1 Tax=Callorhinchus milii TaxID=7868 RepID=UPI0004574056|nr:collectrin isoform X2 [Callorhinchus milii]|eukprot:gi/632948895/ref/XP_007889849.1/ PREDICTED: collectrin isoform X1 [Callorhinchus milii]